jgi:predicted house-cleaning noncanonical NTP pyrophosphatase (MazG superfamily)
MASHTKGAIQRDARRPSMKTIQYNKLVRDKIPEIIAQSGKTCTVETLDDETYLRMAEAKLDEELAEYHASHSVEELADLLEVIYAVTQASGHTLEELEAIRAEKAAARGAFQKKLLLREVVTE